MRAGRLPEILCNEDIIVVGASGSIAHTKEFRSTWKLTEFAHRFPFTEGLCSGCMFYGAVDVDGRLGCSFHWFDDESEDWNYSKNCDELCGM